jgi:hypothetical protein
VACSGTGASSVATNFIASSTFFTTIFSGDSMDRFYSASWTSVTFYISLKVSITSTSLFFLYIFTVSTLSFVRYYIHSSIPRAHAGVPGELRVRTFWALFVSNFGNMYDSILILCVTSSFIIVVVVNCNTFSTRSRPLWQGVPGAQKGGPEGVFFDPFLDPIFDHFFDKFSEKFKNY